MSMLGLTRQSRQPEFDSLESRLLLSGQLITFPTWDQDGPVNGTSTQWNQYCPMDPWTETPSETGCTATAEAQVLYYWKFPPSMSFSESNDAYTSEGDDGPINIDADSGTYMFPSFTTLNSRLSSIKYNGSADEEALLSFAVGVKAQEDYASDGSGADLLASTLGGIGFESADQSTDWDSIEPTVISNIQSGQPVLISIYDAEEANGHCVVLDGYNSSDGTFHVNLGWGSDGDNENGNNDWYSLPNITADGINYTTIDTIIYNIEPVLPAPTGVTASQGTYQNHVALSWNTVPEAIGYDVWRNTTNDPSTATDIYSGLSGTSFTDYSVNQSQSYYYWVQSLSDVGGSDMLTPVQGYTAGAYVDLAGRLVTPWTLPSSVIGGTKLTGTASVQVLNLGNMALPAGQQVNLQVVARDLTNPVNPDITLGTLSNQSVSDLSAGGSLTFHPAVSLAGGLAADNYEIMVNIIPVQSLTEFRTDNNQVSQTAFGQTQTIAVTAPFVDLTGQFGSSLALPGSVISGNGKLITVPVVVTNIGNVPLPAAQKINIEIDAFDGTTTTVLKTLAGQSVSALGAGKSATFSTTVTLPPGLATGTYHIVATVDSTDLVTGDPSRANNTVTSSTRMSVTYGYVDVTGIFGTTWTLPLSVVATLPLKGNASVVVKNIGNVALPTGQMVNIQLVAQDTTVPANAPIVLDTLSNQSVSVLAAGGSKQFSVPVNLAGGLTADAYQILANITPVQALTESDTTNNQASRTAGGLTETVVSAPAFVDLSAGFGSTMKLPASGTSGDGKLITVPVMVTNIGNVALGTGQKISIEIDAFDGTTTTVLKTLTAQSVSALGAGKSATFSTTVTLPIGLTSGAYNIVAKVDSTGAVTGDTNRANNTVTSAGTIAVTHGLVNLSASTLGTSTLPASPTAGALLKGTVSVTMKNTGTVAMPIGLSGTIQLVAHNTTTSVDVPLGTIDGVLTAALAVNATKAFTVNVNLPAGLTAGTYQIEATITPDSSLADFTAGLYTVLTNALGKTLTITAH